jgi:hypothetical protein
MIGDAEKMIAEALDKLRADVLENEAALYDLLVRFVFSLETKAGGRLSRGRDNRRAVLRFDTEIEKFLIESGYRDTVQNFLVNFDELENIQKGIYKDLNGINLKSDFLNPYKEWAARRVIRDLDSTGALAGAVVDPIQNALFGTVQKGGSLSDLFDEIEALVLTNDDRRGILSRYTIQVTRDTLNGYEGAVGDAVKTVYNLNAIKYTGSIGRDSRPQCIRWLNKTENGEAGVLLLEDLEREINWAYNNGSGMHPGTTPDNFLQHRGGYNCRHHGYPFRV